MSDRNSAFSRFLTVLVIIFSTEMVWGQMPQPVCDVYIYVEHNQLPMKRIASQTEIRPGWLIQGKSVGRKMVHYLARRQSLQIVEPSPRFAIYPQGNFTLADYALVKLVRKSNYRLFPTQKRLSTVSTPLDLNHFKVENLPNMGFAVTPIIELKPGEYCLMNLKEKEIDEYGNVYVYDFTVK
jgi:hypothetical protein